MVVEEKIVEPLPEQSSNRTTEDPPQIVPVFQGVHLLYVLFLAIFIARHPFIAFLSILIALLAITVQGLQKSRKASVDGNDSLGMSTRKARTKKKGTRKEKQISHEHDLELKNYNKPFICSGCKELGFGPRFRCVSCDYELHKECKECKECKKCKECKEGKECRTSKREISPNNFLKEYTFEFFDHKLNRICDACAKDICGFAYHNKAKSLDLHPCCSNLKGKLCIDGYDFKLHDKVLSKCKWCNKKKIRGDEIPVSGWSYISDCKKKPSHFHVFCVTEMVSEAWRRGFIDNIDSMALKKLDTQLVLDSNRNDGRKSDHQFSRHTTKMFLKTTVGAAGVLLGDPTMLLASFLVDLFT